MDSFHLILVQEAAILYCELMASWFLGLSNLKFQLQQSLKSDIATSRVKGTHHYHPDVCSDVHYYQLYYQGGWVSWFRSWVMDPESLIGRALFCSPRGENKMRCLFLGVFIKSNPTKSTSLNVAFILCSEACSSANHLNHRIILVAGYL